MNGIEKSLTGHYNHHHHYHYHHLFNKLVWKLHADSMIHTFQIVAKSEMREGCENGEKEEEWKGKWHII